MGCGATSAKRDLVRFVRTPEGRVEPDPTGKARGRGAYLCQNSDCWEPTIAKGKLERALKTRLSGVQRAALVAYGKERLDSGAE